MLTVYDRRGPHRRDFLKIGGWALGGLSWPTLLSAASESGETSALATDKSVVFLFMHGGPSQQETFDPKMSAPPGVRSVNGEVSTTLPGVTFGSSLPKLAQLADKLAIVRSFATGDGIHDIKPVVSRATSGANIGALFARIAGTNDPLTGMPTNTALYPRAVDASAQPANMNFGQFGATGPLSSAYAPFVPGTGGELQENMRLRVSMDRLDDRRRLLSGLDRLRTSLETDPAQDEISRLRQRAFRIILGGSAEAFDLSQEDPKTIARYDTAPLVQPDAISRKWNNYDNYVDNARSLGKLMLLARRLCEAGCRFITITTNFVWDLHADRNNAGVEEGMRYLGPPFDHAVAAFIDDLHERGLADKVLLVATGEMGRTPRINNRGGRDHWGRLAPLMLAGGGLQMGQVIGESTRDAGEPLTDAFTIPNLVATMMHTMFDVGQLRVARGVPEPVLQAATAAEPISGLL